MNTAFLKQICDSHKRSKSFPDTFLACQIFNNLLSVLFPGQSKEHFASEDDIEVALNKLKGEFLALTETLDLGGKPATGIVNSFFEQHLPVMYANLKEDIQALVDGDPAALDEFEVVRAYPGFYAIAFYRIAHTLWNLEVPYLPRIMTEYVHSKTGIDIHPGAQIAPGFFIDHGTGIVVGETTVIGRGVKLYQGVTLGALSVSKDLASTKRHPTIEDNVVIYANATILGGETIVGANSTIGGSVWLTKSLPAHSVVYHKAQVKITDTQN
ncbi:serine O-acetyltransferase [Cyclobacteriaceae bacterium]|nr:serine O-acetyltransferase [Cyclobacteriaceae bacterium]